MKDRATIAHILASLMSTGRIRPTTPGPDGSAPDSDRVRERRRRNTPPFNRLQENERRRHQIERGVLRPNCRDAQLWERFGDRFEPSNQEQPTP